MSAVDLLENDAEVRQVYHDSEVARTYNNIILYMILIHVQGGRKVQTAHYHSS